MNRKTLTLAIATTLMLPVTASADVKLSGTIQAEAGGAVLGQVNGEEKDSITLSTDSFGALVNSGPNHIRLDVDEKLGGGLTAYGRYRVPFNTTTNSGLGNAGQEAWLGLKASNFWLKFGKIEGVYKLSKGLVDPFGATAIQQRGTAGGMSGSARPGFVTPKSSDVAALLPKDATAIEYQKWANKKTYQLKYKAPKKNADGTVAKNDKGAVIYDSYSLPNEFTFETGPFESTNHNGLAHSGEVNNLLEVGIKAGDLSLTVQGVFDETTAMKSAGLVEVKYSMADTLTVFAAASSDELFDQDFGKNGMLNWKVGGQFKMSGLVLGLQYEDAEMGAFDPNPNGGKYILGSVDYKLNNVLVGGWVSQYTSDIKDGEKWTIDGQAVGEDALNWAVGIKYLFSARTLAYLGYLQTDSDNDYRDQQIYGGGLRHSF